jgi:hypothetical protein
MHQNVTAASIAESVGAQRLFVGVALCHLFCEKSEYTDWVRVTMVRRLFILFLLSNIAFLPVFAQKTISPALPLTLTYADVADLALAARSTLSVRIRKAERLRGAEAATVLPGRKRFLVVAEVMALIRGREAIAPRITYLIDVAPDARGKFPKLVGGQAIIFAQPVADHPSEVRLVSPDAQVAATPELLTRVRSILFEADRPNAAPAITGINTAFHVPGSLPGEGETQIFLDTVDDLSISLTILRSLNAAPRWYVSLGEIVDQGAGPPSRNTLNWYRLACFLPRALPPASTQSLEPDQAAIAAEDYKSVITGLGECLRTLVVRPGT